MAWHFTFMWLFALNGVLYVAYTAWSGEWRFLVPNRHTFAEAWQVVLHDLGCAKQPLPRASSTERSDWPTPAWSRWGPGRS